jgi:hypothetical protein
VHQEHDHVLERPVHLLDLVVVRSVMLSDALITAPVLGLALASAAGFSQLFSP